MPNSVAPVLVGAGAAAAIDRFDPWLSLLALVVAMALQLGVNYANDYSDGIRGTDTERVGPLRLVASGLATPAADCTICTPLAPVPITPTRLSERSSPACGHSAV